MVERKNFSEVFEGKGGDGTPYVTLRRMTDEEMAKLGLCTDTTVGLFHGAAPIAIVDFDDLFDIEGNRFYND